MKNVKTVVLIAFLMASFSSVLAQVAIPVTNASTTGTVVNSTAIINASINATLATTSSTTVPTYIVAGGAGTVGQAQLVVLGQTTCIMDSTISSGASWYYVINSTSTAGDCHAQAAAPSSGTWVIGYLSASSTGVGTPALVNVSSYIYGGSGGGGGPPSGSATGALSGSYPGPQLVSQIVVTGADPTGATDSYAAIQAALTASIAGGACIEVYLPVGHYITSAGLTASANCVRFRGAGSYATSITASGTGYNTLTVGNGASGQVQSTGYVEDMSLVGPGITNAGFSSLQINGLTQFRVVDVTATTNDMGFDLVNNCYGSQFENLRGGFGGTLNVAINLRTGSQSGSDLSFYNPWVAGVIAAIQAAGGGGGYHIWGGQLSSGQTTVAAADTSASVILGKDYLTGATGEGSMDLHGTSFEGAQFTWLFRAFNQVHLVCEACSLNPSQSAAPAIGVYKNSAASSSVVSFINTGITGWYSNTALLVDSGRTSTAGYYEAGTYTAAANPHINGSSTYVSCMIIQSAMSAGVCANFVGFNGQFIAGTAATLGAGKSLVALTADGQVPVTVTTGASATLGASFQSGYTINENATAATAVTYTLPTAAAGRKYCVANAYNGTAPNTGVLTLQTSASGQFIIFTDGTLSATGGFVSSGGAAADKACVTGVDATHWLLSTESGTWTKH